MKRFMIPTIFLFAAVGTFAQGQSQAPQKPAQTPPMAAPQTGTPLTLAQAEATALRNNPQITIGKLRALQAQQYVREQRSALLPTAYLSLTGVDSEAAYRLSNRRIACNQGDSQRC